MKQYLTLTNLAIVLASVSIALQVGYMSAGNDIPRIVVIDTARITNSARNVAASLMSGNMSSTLQVSDLGNRLKVAIDEQGAGAVVLDKQSVVRGELHDITDQVLMQVGLPLDAPTIKPDFSSMSMADTSLTKSPVYQVKEEELADRGRLLKSKLEKDKKNEFIP